MSKEQKIAIFDIDGTIFRKNLHYELIEELVWMKCLPKDIRKQLVALYNNWLEHKGDYENYRDATVKLYGKYIVGCSKKDVIKASKSVISFHESRTYIFTEQLIEKFKKEGYHIIAVSGSPAEVVEEYNRKRLKFDEVFGSVYETDSKGKYTGRTVFEPVKNKGQVVKQYIFENKLTTNNSYGIGDTESDESFLKLVENPIAFNPNHNLRNIAKRRNWRVVVEKKDVIYEIKE